MCMLSLEILVHNTGCMCWSKRSGEAQTQLVSSLSLVKGLKSKNQTKLSGSTPAACPYYQATFPCEKCHYSTQERGGRELAVATMEASCVLWDLARKVSGTHMNSPLPDMEGTQGVMRPSRAEMAVQYSSSSRQPAQAVERSTMSNYVLCYNTATQGGLNGSFQLLPDCC